MTQNSGPWSGQATGDAGPYSFSDWLRIWKTMVGGDVDNVGVFGRNDDRSQLKVSESSPAALSVDVAIGGSIVNGLWYESDAVETLSIANNASGSTRIDRIVVRSTYSTQQARLTVIQGTPAAGAPAITQTNGFIWDIPLAQVEVANGAVSILDANITDEREFVVRKIPYIEVRHEETSGTNGGTATAGSWETRTLNTEAHDTDNIASLSGNQVTLPAGTYQFRVHLTIGNSVTAGAGRLYDATGAAVLSVGSSSVQNTELSFGGRFTLTVASAIELQSRVVATKATDGWGLARSWGTEVYAIVSFWKES